MRILVVDDELPMRVALVECLQSEGYRVRAAGDDGLIELNAKEVGILTLLMEFRGQVVTRERFLDEVWGYHANPTSRTVDNFIAELRKKPGRAARL